MRLKQKLYLQIVTAFIAKHVDHRIICMFYYIQSNEIQENND